MPAIFTDTDNRVVASIVTPEQRHLDAGGHEVGIIPDPVAQEGKQAIQYYTVAAGFTTTYVDLPADDPRMMAVRLSAVETEVTGIRDRAAAVSVTEPDAGKVRDAIAGKA